MDTHSEYMEKVTGITPENAPEPNPFATPIDEAVTEFDQELYDNAVYGSDTPEQTTDEKLDEILSLLRPLAPALRALPEVVEQIGPIIDGLKKSPVLKALGVRLP